ncbi:C2H2 finger domain protein [Xylaria grammica]|nr:C2H2 finger domain protein [Xylaria grammica]
MTRLYARDARFRRPSIDLDDSFCPQHDSDEEMVDLDDLLSFYEDSDLFDVEPDQDAASETDLRDDEDEGGDEGDDVDIEDQARLWGNNKHPSEYYIKALEEFDESAFDDQDYSPGSTVLLDGVENGWSQFCAYIRRNPMETFQHISIKLLYLFFDWRLNLTENKDGRKLRGIATRSSLGTYWKVFRLVYERATGDKLDAKLNRKMHRALRKLADKYSLSNKKREKRCMTIEDLKKQIYTTLSTTKKSFKLGELRILCIIFHLMLAPSGSRPRALLLMRFGDIRISLARDPEGGPHRVVIRSTLEYTKTYLGTKEANTFPLPEVMWDPSLLLSPHVFILGVLFANRAFAAPNLNCPEILSRLAIHPDEQELPLPPKSGLDKMLVFRKAIKTLTGYVMSESEGLPYSTMAPWIRVIGELTGFKVTTIPYNLRYNAAYEFDQSGDVSDGLRNLIMQHSDSRVLLKHYLQREIGADTLAIIRGLEPQRALMKTIRSLGSSINKRRPIRLTGDQSASVSLDPHVAQLVRRRAELFAEAKKSTRARQAYLRASKKVEQEKLRLRRALKKQIRDQFDSTQAVIDIERQIAGMGFTDNAETEMSARPQLPAQKRLVKAICAPMNCKSVEEQYRRRDAALNAVIAYCTVEEDWGSAHRTNIGAKGPTKASSTVAHGQKESPKDSLVYQCLLSVFKEDPEERSYRCFICVGKAWQLWNAGSLGEDDPRLEQLTHEFHAPGDLTRHFRRKHLKNLQKGELIRCTACDLHLEHQMHLQNHARTVHGTVVTRPLWRSDVERVFTISSQHLFHAKSGHEEMRSQRAM